jgi:hypothetical protein
MSARPRTAHAFRRLPTFFALTIASVLLAASPAAAFHIPSATYSGTHTGGGTVSFQVSADGSQIASWTVRNVPGTPSCFWTEASPAPPFTIPIVNQAFDDSYSDGSFFRGTFDAVRSASGTLRLNDPSGPCDTGTVSWKATTTASPAGSQECVAATAALKKATKAFKKAKKALKKAKKAQRKASSPRATKRVKKAKKKYAKAKKKYGKAKKAKRAVCG